MNQQYYTPQPVQPLYGQQPLQQQPVYQQIQDTNPSCRQLVMQPFQFGPHYPAPTPAIQTLPPALQQALPLIAIEAGNFLNQNAAANPVYTYYFNIVSQNGFRNGFWERLVHFAGHYTWLVLQQRLYATDQEAIRQAAQFSVQTMASVTAMENPQIQAFIDANLWQGCMAIAQKFQSVQAQFAQLGQPQQQQVVQGGYQQQAYGQATYQPQPVQPNVWNTQQQQPQHQPVTTDAMGGSSVVYSSRAVHVPQQEQSQVKKYMTIPGSEQPVTDTTVRMEPVQQRPEIKGILMSPGGGIQTVDSNTPEAVPVGNWAPFYGQYYVPAFDSNYQKLTMVSRAVAGLTGNRNIFLVENKGASEMNRAEHVIGTARSMYRDVNPNNVPRVQAVGSDLELAAKALEVTTNQESDETTKAYKEMGLVAMDMELAPEDSVVGLVNAARILRMTHQQQPHAAFSVTGSVATKFITRSSFHSLFETLGNMKTFGDMVDVLKVQAGKEQDSDTASLIGRIDRYLTREVLHVIRHRMGLTHFSFDSFIDDIADVFAVLKSDWGDLYVQALIKFQDPFITATFGVDALSYMDSGDDSVMECVASEPAVSVTLLDVDSDEFGIKIPDDAAYEVFATNFPGLYEFIEAVAVSQPSALHHYIVTDDDVVFEVHQSLVGTKVFSISKGPVIA